MKLSPWFLISCALFLWSVHSLTSIAHFTNIYLDAQKFYYYKYEQKNLPSLSQFSITAIRSELSAPVQSEQFDVFLLSEEDYNCYLFRVFYFKDWNAHCSFLDDPSKLKLKSAYFTEDYSNFNGTYVLLVDNTPFPQGGGFGQIPIELNHKLKLEVLDKSSIYDLNLTLMIAGGLLFVGLIVLIVVVIRNGLQIKKLNKGSTIWQKNQFSTGVPYSSGKEWIERLEQEQTEESEEHEVVHVQEVRKSWNLFKKPVVKRSKFFVS